ncbi:hypothetical protein BD779DRAFT_1668340 [Infundibulicybe gibba]|nr:hypothetical protein BD779DRAFT_1668340 [Infundibulicybe gibba]
MSLRVVPLLLRGDPARAPNVTHAVSILVSAKRILAARKLFARTHRDLDPKSKTLIANIILHGYLNRPHSQNARLVRHILRTKAFLEAEYAVVSDQVTTNIVIKALLQRPAFLDATRVRTVFDHLVRCGYPAGGTPAAVVPFGTRAAAIPGGLRLPAPAPPTSFNKHIRPLYKMFIKAFYLRGDIHAAKTVVGILQREAAAAAYELAKRNHARRLGRVRKARKSGAG